LNYKTISKIAQRFNIDKIFTTQTNYSTGSYGVRVVVYDFNGDNRKDIVVISRYDKTINLFVGFGNGSFTS